jgi:uncharacterized tellurite resistance protein B-like protein
VIAKCAGGRKGTGDPPVGRVFKHLRDYGATSTATKATSATRRAVPKVSLDQARADVDKWLAIDARSTSGTVPDHRVARQIAKTAGIGDDEFEIRKSVAQYDALAAGGASSIDAAHYRRRAGELRAQLDPETRAQLVADLDKSMKIAASTGEPETRSAYHARIRDLKEKLAR